MQTFNSKSQHLLLAFPFIMLLVGIVAVEVFNICSGLTFLLVTLLFLSISAPVWLNPELRRQAFYPYSYFAYQGMVSFALPSLLVWIDREVGTPLEPFPQSVLLISGAFWGYWIGFRSNWGGHLAKVIPLYAFPHSRTKWANRNLWAVTIILYGVGWLGRLYRANMGFSHLPTDYGHLRIYIGFFSDLASFATLSYVLMLYFLFKNSNRKLLFIPILVLVSFEVAAGALYGGQ